jgi:hypothetical protein
VLYLKYRQVKIKADVMSEYSFSVTNQKSEGLFDWILREFGVNIEENQERCAAKNAQLEKDIANLIIKEAKINYERIQRRKALKAQNLNPIVHFWRWLFI